MTPSYFDPDEGIEPLREPAPVLGAARRPWRRAARSWPQRWRALAIRRACELSRVMPFAVAEKRAYEEVERLISEQQEIQS